MGGSGPVYLVDESEVESSQTERFLALVFVPFVWRAGSWGHVPPRSLRFKRIACSMRRAHCRFPPREGVGHRSSTVQSQKGKPCFPGHFRTDPDILPILAQWPGLRASPAQSANWGPQPPRSGLDAAPSQNSWPSLPGIMIGKRTRTSQGANVSRPGLLTWNTDLESHWMELLPAAFRHIDHNTLRQSPEK